MVASMCLTLLFGATDLGDTCDIFTHKVTGETFRGRLTARAMGTLYVKVPTADGTRTITRKLKADEWSVKVQERGANVPTSRPVATAHVAPASDTDGRLLLAMLANAEEYLAATIRRHRVLLVWLYDEADTSPGKRKIVSKAVGRMYDRLGAQDQIVAAVVTYNRAAHIALGSPRAGGGAVVRCVTRAPVAEGASDHVAALGAAAGRYAQVARLQNRRLVFCILSDVVPDGTGERRRLAAIAERAAAHLFAVGL